MEIRQGYKKTEVGIIPEEWEVKKLGECFEVIMGQSPSSKAYNEEKEGLPLVQGNADIRNNKVYPRMYTSEITKESYPNDLIMTVRAPVGYIYISDIHSCIGRGICAIRNGNKYLYYYLFNYKDRWKRLAQGSTFTAITVKDIKELNIPIPPLKEQEKIADILSYYDKAIEQEELLLEKEKDFKKGMMQKIFSQEIRFKDDNEENYPEWEEKRLGEISNIYQPKTISQNEMTSTGYSVYGANGIIGKYHSYNHETSQIVITCRGNTCGTVNFTKEKSWITGNAMVINSDNNSSIIKKYLYYFLIQDSLKYLITGSGQPQITGNIKFHKINLPILEEQEKIASFLSNIDNKIELLEKKLELLKNEKKGMMQKLLTGEVRV